MRPLHASSRVSRAFFWKDISHGTLSHRPRLSLAPSAPRQRDLGSAFQRVPAHPKSTRHDEGAWWQVSVVAEREHETQDWLRGTLQVARTRALGRPVGE